MPITHHDTVKTVGELRALLHDLPDETPMSIDRGFDGIGDVTVSITSTHNNGDRIVEFS